LLDVHKTQEAIPQGDPARHETLAILPIADLIQQMTTFDARLLAEFLHLWRPLRMGWMIRRGLAIGPRFPREVQLQGVKGISIRQGSILANDQIATWMRPPE
jgi:hypothetical protein